jgi:hypothetical protein
MQLLFKSARLFEQKVAAANFDAILGQMRQYAAGALTATKHLLSKPKYHRSPGLLTIEGQIPILTSLLQSTNTENAYRTLPKIEELIGGLVFYTSPANKSMGYDPLTTAREEGYSAPSYFIGALAKLNDALKKSIVPSQNQKPTNVA